jgi:hypothetical protein
MISDAQIERVARRMCLFMRLDPDEIITYGHGDDMKVAERASLSSFYSVALHGSRWETYRAVAEQHIAASMAIGLE